MSPWWLMLSLSGAPGLEAVLERELETLATERAGLEATERELEGEIEAQKASLLESARARAAELERLRAEATALQSELRNLERNPASAVSYAPIFAEARQLLEAEVPATAGPEALLELFGAASTALDRAGSLHEDSEVFYDTGGHPLKGRVMHAGALSAFGLADGSRGVIEGPLVQVDGAWKLVESADVGRIFGEAEGSRVVPVAVSPAAFQEASPPGWRERLEAAGPFGVPILALAVLVVLAALERVFALTRASRGDTALERALVLEAKAADPDRLHGLVVGKRTGVARIGQALVASARLPDEGRRDLVESALVDEISRVERRLPFLRLAAAAAPLLGLLGTVAGMIETFDVISLYGSGDASRLSGGISKALVTTELGLLVAIPTLFVASFLSSWVDRIADRLERVARDVPALSLGERAP